MFTRQGHTPGFTHIFTSDKPFLLQEDWVLKYKGTEVYTAWKELMDSETYQDLHPDIVAMYEEWTADQGITHTMTEDENDK